jgi:signal transduction histidine kinase
LPHDLRRLNMHYLEPELVQCADRLVSFLADASERIRPIDRLPTLEIKIECILETIDIIQIIERTMKLANSLEPDRNITVIWRTRPDGTVYIDADKEYLPVALDAVFHNAVKYSFNNKEVRVKANVDDGWFVLQVSDYGIGIPPAKNLKLFEFGQRAEVEELFQGRTRTGWGMGLASARRIIQAHNGTITIESIPPASVPPEKDDYRRHEVVVTIRLPLSERAPQ